MRAMDGTELTEDEINDLLSDDERDAAWGEMTPSSGSGDPRADRPRVGRNARAPARYDAARSRRSRTAGVSRCGARAFRTVSRRRTARGESEAAARS